MDTIKDGTGSGYLVGVNDKNMMMVEALNLPNLFYYSVMKKRAFSAGFKHTIQAAGVDEVIGILTYTGKKTLVVERIKYLTTSSGLSQFKMKINVIYASGGVAQTPINTNSGSKKSIPVTVYGTSNGTNLINTINGYSIIGYNLGYHNNLSYVLETSGSLSLSPNTSISMLCNSAAVGDIVNGGFLIYEI